MEHAHCLIFYLHVFDIGSTNTSQTNAFASTSVIQLRSDQGNNQILSLNGKRFSLPIKIDMSTRDVSYIHNKVLDEQCCRIIHLLFGQNAVFPFDSSFFLLCNIID